MTQEEFDLEILKVRKWLFECVPAAPYDLDEAIEDVKDHVEEKGDEYEVVCDIHLVNGDCLRLTNHMVESYLCRRNLSDNMFLDSGWLYVERTSDDGILHQERVNPEHVVRLDQYARLNVWKDNEEYIINKLKEEACRKKKA